MYFEYNLSSAVSLLQKSNFSDLQWTLGIFLPILNDPQAFTKAKQK